jgi:hypothetical protein
MFTDYIIHGYNKNGIPLISLPFDNFKKQKKYITQQKRECKKRKYNDRISAQRELAFIRKEGRRECRVYYCDNCRCWHLTSKEKERVV